jgi:protein PhnA
MVVILEVGNSVVLIKDLKVKGSSIVAKQGTAVRNIRLDHDNAEYGRKSRWSDYCNHYNT